MGYDVSYHPISPEQIQSWYFTALQDPSHVNKLCEEFQIHPLYQEKYRDVLDQGRQLTNEGTFDTTHGFLIAVVQGFFARHHYIRGSALSFCAVAHSYSTPWQAILQESQLTQHADNAIVENYSSGLYLSAEGVKKLLADSKTKPEVQQALQEVFPDKHFTLLTSILEETASQNLGLLEATEVIEPNPMDLESTFSHTNLFNCDTTGPQVYQETAMQQLRGLGIDPDTPIERVHHTHSGDPTKPSTISPSPERTYVDETQNKGFLKKFFGKK